MKSEQATATDDRKVYVIDAGPNGGRDRTRPAALLSLQIRHRLLRQNPPIRPTRRLGGWIQQQSGRIRRVVPCRTTDISGKGSTRIRCIDGGEGARTENGRRTHPVTIPTATIV